MTRAFSTRGSLAGESIVRMKRMTKLDHIAALLLGVALTASAELTITGVDADSLTWTNIRPIMATLARKLRGHWNYFGVPHNSKSLWEFYRHACELVYKWLNRRSQRRSFTWARFTAMLERYQIPKPSITEKPPKRRYSYV